MHAGLAPTAGLSAAAHGGARDRRRGCGAGRPAPRRAAWWQEAAAVFDEPALRDWFDAARYDQAYNEVPIQYRHGDALVHGVIDRLVVRGDVCVVIDYKTHRGAAERPDEYAARFTEQLRLYANGAAQLWPGRKVETYLLFTAGRRLYAGS